MSDLISRKAAIAVADFSDYVGLPVDDVKKVTDEVVKRLKQLPYAEQWIPVSERLPQYGEEVVANFRNEQIGRDRIGVSYCYVQKEGFFSDVPFEYKVVAWMPLPEPWRGEEG